MPRQAAGLAGGEDVAFEGDAYGVGIIRRNDGVGDFFGGVPPVFRSDGEAGPLEHVDVVGGVADGHDFGGRDAEAVGDFGQRAGLAGGGAHELEHVGVGAGLGGDFGEFGGDA